VHQLEALERLREHVGRAQGQHAHAIGGARHPPRHHERGCAQAGLDAPLITSGKPGATPPSASSTSFTPDPRKPAPLASPKSGMS
jgi:hypothetical protein